MEIEWDGNVVWQVTQPDNHHDARLLPNGHVLMLCVEEVPPDVAAKVQGGLPGTEHEGLMCGDKVVEVTREGETVWEWHAWQHLDPRPTGSPRRTGGRSGPTPTPWRRSQTAMSW
jgi:hypothetical protein